MMPILHNVALPSSMPPSSLTFQNPKKIIRKDDKHTFLFAPVASFSLFFIHPRGGHALDTEDLG